jgi:hypothetical protein
LDLKEPVANLQYGPEVLLTGTPCLANAFHHNHLKAFNLFHKVRVKKVVAAKNDCWALGDLDLGQLLPDILTPPGKNTFQRKTVKR